MEYGFLRDIPPYLAFLLPPFYFPLLVYTAEGRFFNPSPKENLLICKNPNEKASFLYEVYEKSEARRCTGAATCCARIYNVLRPHFKALQVDFKRVANLLAGLAEAVRTIHY